MNGRIDSGLGQIVIDTDVIATYAGSVAVECFGKTSSQRQPETRHQRNNH